MDGTGILMPLMRALHLAAMVSLLGTAGFIAWMLPAAAAVPDPLWRGLRRLWWRSGVVALLAGVAWFVLQATAIAGAGDASEILASLPLVAEHTRYGTMLMARLALLLLAILAALRWPASLEPAPGSPSGSRLPRLGVYPAMLLLAVALGLQGMIGHAGAAAGVIGEGLVLSEALHLVAAGLWLGALLPLCLAVRALKPADGALVCERFSPIGLGCVVVLAGTGFAQGWVLIGGLPALFGTTYGHLALLKITLFLVGLTLAAINRLWLTDRLGAGVVAAPRHLLVSVGFETLVGLAIVTTAAFLASTVPGMHEAPVWPFSWQFSLTTVNEAPAFRQEVLTSLLLIGSAALLAVAAVAWRRLRLLALLALLAMIAWRGPSFSLLLIEAYPTSFQTSPTGFSAASIVRGQALFARNCVDCHGAAGEGNGPLAAGLRIKPADLTMPHIWEHSDGEMFWWMTHGIDDPEGGLAMPGFGSVLSAEDRWALIDYVRAHAAGVATQQDSAFDAPVRAPGLSVTCNGVAAATMADLQGRAVHVVVANRLDDPQPVPPQSGIAVVTLLVARDPSGDVKPTAGSCVTADPAARDAYAVLAALPPERVAGAAFLVDPNGWLRAEQRPGVTGGWHARDALLAAIRGICAHPIEQPSGAQHEHHF